jgi:tripartite-type tricarboxylate transporter receptor subunit TctC
MTSRLPSATWRAALVLGLVASSALAPFAQAQQYPDKPIRIIVPFPAGDGIDIQARLIGQRLTERLGQQVLVDNRPGAGTLIGTEAATKAAADGYTILLVTTTFTINPSLHAKVPYDPIRDFTPLIQSTAIPLVLVGSNQFPANNLKDVLAAARKDPGRVTYGSSGIGTAAHIGMEMLAGQAKVDFIHVPYKGIPPAVVDLSSGQLPMLITSPAQVMGQIREGKMKALVVTGAKRMAQLPNVETVAENGFPGFEANAFIGYVLPAATPREIVTRLNREFDTILQTPELKTRLTNDGSEVVGGTPEAFGQRIRTDLAKWAKVIKDAGIKPQ